jgi:hypothetical protein
MLFVFPAMTPSWRVESLCSSTCITQITSEIAPRKSVDGCDIMTSNSSVAFSTSLNVETSSEREYELSHAPQHSSSSSCTSKSLNSNSQVSFSLFSMTSALFNSSFCLYFASSVHAATCFTKDKIDDFDSDSCASAGPSGTARPAMTLEDRDFFLGGEENDGGGRAG